MKNFLQQFVKEVSPGTPDVESLTLQQLEHLAAELQKHFNCIDGEICKLADESDEEIRIIQDEAESRISKIEAEETVKFHKLADDLEYVRIAATQLERRISTLRASLTGGVFEPDEFYPLLQDESGGQMSKRKYLTS